ncbi:MAG TPA: hypothetical protein VIF64_21570, partial [Pyrinomonadaceae bacterium]
TVVTAKGKSVKDVLITICKGCLDNKQLRGHPFVEEGILTVNRRYVCSAARPLRKKGGHGVPPLKISLP